MFMVLYSVIGIVAFVVGMILYANVDAMFGKTMTDLELSRARIMMLILAFNLAVTFPFSIYNSIITAYEDFIFQKAVKFLGQELNFLMRFQPAFPITLRFYFSDTFSC